MTDSGGGRARSVAAGIVGVLAVIALLASAVAVWARATVFDGNRVAAMAKNALAQPAVTDALAQRVTDEVFSAVDVTSFLDDVLPDALDRFAPVIAAGLRDGVERGLDRVLANQDVQEVFEAIVRRAHAAAMRLLQGDGLGNWITVEEGAVTLNLIPLIERGLSFVQQFGLLSNVDLPGATADGDPAEQIAALESALGRDLPDDFGQLVVYQSDRLAEAQASLANAQRLFAIAKRALAPLLALTAVLVALTIVLARNRWRAALLLGLGAVAAMVIARTMVRRVRDEAPDLVVRPGAKAAVTSLLDDAASSLLRVFGVLLVVALAVAVIAFFIRRHRRDDMVIAGAVVVGLAVFVPMGFSVWSLLVAIVVAGVAYALLRRFLPPPAVTAGV